MGAPRVTLEKFIERSKLLHDNKYDYSKVEWIDTRHKVEIICPEHGSFLQKPYKHLQGQGCPDCRKNATVTQEEFIARAKKLHGDNTYDYSHVHYVNMWTPVEIICPIHGPFLQMPAKHIKTGKHAHQGCPKCRYVRQRKTNLKRYGVDNPMQNSDFVKANWESKKINGTCGDSKPENKMYEILLERFSKNDVFRNYNKDERYPFACDFYIKSLDLFIELNANWTHGLHWFDSASDADMAKLKLWISRFNETGSRSYKSAINTWTVRDPLKRQTAQDNNLNYLVFWNNDLSDFYEWFNTL